MERLILLPVAVRAMDIASDSVGVGCVLAVCWLCVGCLCLCVRACVSMCVCVLSVWLVVARVSVLTIC